MNHDPLPPCPSCRGKLIERPDSYGWRGQMFSGAFCKACNSLWSIGEGYGEFMKAVKNSGDE